MIEKDKHTRNAIDVTAGLIKEHEEKKGRELTHEQAQKQAVEIAERVEKKERR